MKSIAETTATEVTEIEEKSQTIAKDENSDRSPSPYKLSNGHSNDFKNTPKMRRRLSISMQASRVNFGSAEEFAGLSDAERVKVSRRIDASLIAEIHAQADETEFKLGDVLEYLGSGMNVVVEDDFSLCFERAESRSWNWNFYLFIFWGIGVIIRYCLLFPIRLLIKLLSVLLTLFQLWLWQKLFANDPKKRESWELWTLQLLAQSWIMSWFGVIEYIGVIPQRKPNQIYVANHTTMLDWLLLMQMNPFCVVGQLQSSRPLIAWFQLDLLKSLNCIWFDRKEQKDRSLAMKRIKDHIQSTNKPRLLIFPEGTCVNNEYCIQFKRGSFSLGAEICPIAIKYDKTFVDAYWISRERPFHLHVFDIMTSWAMVTKVYYLEPQQIQPNEKSEDFALRVKTLIADAAGLKNVSWNGYLKHYKPSERIIEEKKKVFAGKLMRLYGKTMEENYLNRYKQETNVNSNGVFLGYSNNSNSNDSTLRERNIQNNTNNGS